MSINLDKILELILGNLGSLIILLFILYGGFKGWWVFGPYYKEMLSSCQTQSAKTEAELRNQIEKLENRLDKSEEISGAAIGSARRATEIAERNNESVRN